MSVVWNTLKSHIMEVLLTLQLCLNYKKPCASFQIHNALTGFGLLLYKRTEIILIAIRLSSFNIVKQCEAI
jgi:hypothetical protein